ncbi:MAG: chromosome partitioning protein ParB [Ardenticatenaceae bacterium]
MKKKSKATLPRFDVPTAQQYAGEGRLEEWVHIYLNTGDWANLGLSEGLKLQKRWWNGPLEVKHSDLVRACGPEAHMEYRLDPDDWSERTSKIAQSLTNPLALPPLIIEYRQGELSIRDGNTRHGAMELKGWQSCWVLIWYNTEDDYLTHRKSLRNENY